MYFETKFELIDTIFEPINGTFEHSSVTCNLSPGIEVMVQYRNECMVSSELSNGVSTLDINQYPPR